MKPLRSSHKLTISKVGKIVSRIKNAIVAANKLSWKCSKLIIGLS